MCPKKPYGNWKSVWDYFKYFIYDSNDISIKKNLRKIIKELEWSKRIVRKFK